MTATLQLPEKRQGQDVIRLFLDERLKEKFKRVCSIKGASMTEEITRFIEESVSENEELLKLVDKKLGAKPQSAGQHYDDDPNVF